MSQLKDISVFDEEFTSQYGKGTVIETNITAIIQPSQIVTVFYEGFTGRLSVLDISWCLPEGEEKLRNSKVGDRIKCVVLSIDFQNKQVMLSQKHLTKPLSDTIKWERIERGDEFQADIIDELNDTLLVKTTKGLYGLIHKSLLKLPFESLKVKVNTKLDYSDLLSFVPASLEIANVISVNEEQTNEFSFIEEDLQSFYKFKRSLLGINASDEICEIIQRGFDADERIFSKEITTPYPLYIQFELNSSIYESIFKQQAIPFFYEGATYSEESERALLEKLAKESYWFKINKRGNRYRENGSGSNNEDVIDFSLFNEQLNFFGEVQISKDKKEYRFLIRNFSFGHTVATASEAKKKNAKYGSFLFSNQLKVLSPFGTLPFGTSQKDFFDFVVLKTQCFETINSLKLDAGEILKQEGRTLAIIDKFLEYQMSLIDEKKENTVLVDKFERIPGQTGGVSIKLPITVANSLEFEEETVVNLRLKKGDELLKLTDGLLTYYQDGCKIVFNKEVNLELLKDGFYIDKRISKRQFQIQREIIQDFLEKKIKIDHIESLLVNPDTIRTPVLANVIFNNPDLQRTEKEQSDNNQVKAVKKAVGNQNIFLIQGPPGTGKTTVIAEIIQQLVAKGEKILVAGQNHVAVDNVLEKIAKIHNLNLLRVGNPERIDKELVQYNIDNLVEDYKVDYAAFVNNQLLLSKKYVELKTSNDGALLESFNKAVNEVSSKYGKLKDVYKERHFILRDGLNELSPKEINEAILSLAKWIESGKNEYEILLRPLIYNSVDVVFATCIGIKTDQIFRNTNFKFDTVIIDEAGKANIAETLVAIELGKKVILVGDQMQLPPYMDSSLIDEREAGSFPKSTYGSNFLQEEIIHALKTSFFEFIINRINAGRFPTENKEMLNYQHRMHPHIGEFVSESFYNGLVQMGSRTHLNRIDMPTPFNKEVVFFDTSNSENPFEQNDGYSAKNNTEAEAISEIILPRLFEHNISPSSIAIIAPYKSQVANIQHFIRNSSLCNFKNIDISTLDSFQGKEYDIILFSFTRSVDHKKAPTINGRKKFSKVGFLDDARRLNVAFSRAKKKLILVGNAVTLTDHKSHYDGLFNYTQLFKKLVQLSNKATIGNFVNIADLHDFKPPFEIFTERHKNGDIVTGQVKMIGRNAKGIFGLFIRIDRVDCLLPWSFMPQDFKAKLESISQGSDIVIVIFDINESNQKITVKLASFWEANIPKLKPTGRYKGIVKNKVQFGYFILLECGLEGLLHRSQLRRNQQFQEGQSLEVIVLKIDNDKKQIDLGI